MTVSPTILQDLVGYRVHRHNLDTCDTICPCVWLKEKPETGSQAEDHLPMEIIKQIAALDRPHDRTKP